MINKRMMRSCTAILCVLLALAAPGLAKEFADVLVSNVFYDSYVLDALNDIAVQSGIPIIADSTVSGFITTDFTDLPLEDALSRICVPPWGSPSATWKRDII